MGELAAKLEKTPGVGMVALSSPIYAEDLAPSRYRRDPSRGPAASYDLP